jgi:DNA-binding winged helix-turn-helix (wHTH) protein
MFDLLLVLVQHPGRVLGKDFLAQIGLAGQFCRGREHHFQYPSASEKPSTTTVQSPLYIETIPRRGYRFLAPVDASTATSPDDTDPAADISSHRTTRRVQPAGRISSL